MALQGISDTDPIPRFARQFIPAAGSSLSNGGPLTIAIVANKLASGTEVVETVGDYVRSPADCFGRFGRRSEAAWMYRLISFLSPQALVRIVAVAEGGGAAVAARVFTFETDAAIGCTLYMDSCVVNVPGKSRINATIALGDDPQTQAESMAAAINNDPDLPFAATTGIGAMSKGSLTSSAGAFPVALVDGDTFLGKVDEQGSADTLTIVANQASITFTGGSYGAGAGGDSITIRRSIAGVLITTTLDLSAVGNTQQDYLDAINTLTGLSAAASGPDIVVTVDQAGSGSAGNVTALGGAAATKLGATVAAFTLTPGSNVANVDQVTAAEFAGLLSATFTGGTAGSTGIDNGDGSVTWRTNTAGASPKGVQFTSGTGVSKITGFDLTEHNGAAATTWLLTLTTYQKGVRSQAWLSEVRFAYDDPTVGSTISAGSVTGGTGVDDVADAITALDAGTLEHTFIVAAMTATAGVTSGDGGLGALAAYVNSSGLPVSGKDQQLIFAVDGTSSQATAVSQSAVMNSVACKGAYYGSDNDWPPSMMAAAYAGILHVEQSVYAGFNFRDYVTNNSTGRVCPFPPPFLTSNRPTRTDTVVALNGGMSVFNWDNSGNGRIVRDISTLSWVGSVATADYRGREGHIWRVIQTFWKAFRDRAIAQGLTAGNIAKDPKKGNKPTPGMVYPHLVISCINALIAQMVGAFQSGKPLLDPTYTAQMVDATDVAILDAGGWLAEVALRVVRHNLFNDVRISETSDPS